MPRGPWGPPRVGRAGERAAAALSAAPAPAASASRGNQLGVQIAAPAPDQLKQKPGREGPAICILTSPLGDSGVLPPTEKREYKFSKDSLTVRPSPYLDGRPAGRELQLLPGVVPGRLTRPRPLPHTRPGARGPRPPPAPPPSGSQGRGRARVPLAAAAPPAPRPSVRPEAALPARGVCAPSGVGEEEGRGRGGEGRGGAGRAAERGGGERAPRAGRRPARSAERGSRGPPGSPRGTSAPGRGGASPSAGADAPPRPGAAAACGVRAGRGAEPGGAAGERG